MFRFSCAQSDSREHKVKVSKSGTTPRETRRMERFPCNGWFHISVHPESDVVGITIKHAMEHEGYRDEDLPEKWKEYIRENAGKMTAAQVGGMSDFSLSYLSTSRTQIWRHIVRTEMEGPDATEVDIPLKAKPV